MMNIDEVVETVLKPIHSSLDKFTPRDHLMWELPEQIMAVSFIKPDDCVLELGGSIGRNSCVINTILNVKSNHVVCEPSLNEATKLQYNRDSNNLHFHIERSAISNVALYSKGWYTYPTQVPGSVAVSTITYPDLKRKYDLSFNVLVIDNEGNFTKTLKDYPEILDGIRLLLIEHDFNSQEDLTYFTETMLSNGFSMTGEYPKTAKYGPGINWGDGLKTDPIFVSAWVREL